MKELYPDLIVLGRSAIIRCIDAIFHIIQGIKNLYSCVYIGPRSLEIAIEKLGTSSRSKEKDKGLWGFLCVNPGK